VKALTVQQPWAWAIVHGGKDVENRSRNLAGSYRGPVAIHAGKREDEDGYYDDMIREALGTVDDSWAIEERLARSPLRQAAPDRPGVLLDDPVPGVVGWVHAPVLPADADGGALMAGPKDDWQMPSHVVDQYAARLRDSGVPPAAIKLVVTTVASVLSQLASATEAVAPVMTSTEIASLTRAFSTAWDQMRDTL
jgi:hypothetical protein